LIHVAETIAVGSIESFVDSAGLARLAAIMDGYLTVHRRDQFGPARVDTIHEIPGQAAGRAMAVYEPAGRLEVPRVPDQAEAILQDAFRRCRPALSRVMPSVTACRPWAYVEYGPGQHITSHLDGIAPDPLAWPRQVAGISVVVTEPESGGGFYVETTSSDILWESRLGRDDGHGYAGGMWLARDGADQSAPWFTGMHRTRWTVPAPAPGTALLYGSQLAHGTQPVTAGRSGKFISWLVADGGASPAATARKPGGAHAAGD
jgi:hypothetical protein